MFAGDKLQSLFSTEMVEQDNVEICDPNTSNRFFYMQDEVYI